MCGALFDISDIYYGIFVSSFFLKKNKEKGSKWEIREIERRIAFVFFLFNFILCNRYIFVIVIH